MTDIIESPPTIPLQSQNQNQHTYPPPLSVYPKDKEKESGGEAQQQQTISQTAAVTPAPLDVFDDRPLIVKAKYYERLAANALRRGDFKKVSDCNHKAAEMYKALIDATPSKPVELIIRKLRDSCLLQASTALQLGEAVLSLVEFFKTVPQEVKQPDPTKMDTQDLINYAKKFPTSDKKVSALLCALVEKVETMYNELNSKK